MIRALVVSPVGVAHRTAIPGLNVPCGVVSELAPSPNTIVVRVSP
jgi:hypothetical protein